MKGAGIKRGALIVFEGCDRTGKTTQCRKLVEKLSESGIPAQMMQFPDRTTATGKIISNYLSKKEDLPDQAVHLLFSANRWESQPKMKKLLKSGVTLIVDRYSYSGVAYSAAKLGMDFEWCHKPEIGLPKPDLVFLFHLPSNTINERQGFGDERYENDSFLQNVYKNYLKMKQENWMVIDASKSIDELHSDLLKQVLEAIEKVQEAELKELWYTVGQKFDTTVKKCYKELKPKIFCYLQKKLFLVVIRYSFILLIIMCRRNDIKSYSF